MMRIKRLWHLKIWIDGKRSQVVPYHIAAYSLKIADKIAMSYVKNIVKSGKVEYALLPVEGENDQVII